MATKSTFWLLSRLRAAKGPLAFVDESFMSPSQDADSFYILGAVVVQKKKVFALRAELQQLVGDDYFHATESGRHEGGRQLIRQMADLIAREAKPVLVVLNQLETSDEDAERARSRVIKRLFEELSENQMYLTGTVVYERRMRSGQHEADLRIFRGIRQQKLPGSKLRILGIATKHEPLLWAPDLVSWAFRQAYREDNPSYFTQLKKVAKIIWLD